MSKFVPVRKRHGIEVPAPDSVIERSDDILSMAKFTNKVDDAFIAEVERILGTMDERLADLGLFVKRSAGGFETLLASALTGNGIYELGFINKPDCNADGRNAILQSARAEIVGRLASEGLAISQSLTNKSGPETSNKHLIFTVADLVDILGTNQGLFPRYVPLARKASPSITEEEVLADQRLMQQAIWADGDWPLWLEVYGHPLLNINHWPKARDELLSFTAMYLNQQTEEIGLVPVHTTILDCGTVLHATTFKSMAINKSRVCKSDLLFAYAKARGDLNLIGMEVPEIMTDAARQVIQGLRMSPRGHSQTFGGLVKHLEASGVKTGWMPGYATSEMDSKSSIPKGAEADLIWRAMASCIVDPGNSPLEPLEDLIESYKRSARRLRAKPDNK